MTENEMLKKLIEVGEKVRAAQKVFYNAVMEESFRQSYADMVQLQDEFDALLHNYKHVVNQ